MADPFYPSEDLSVIKIPMKFHELINGLSDEITSYVGSILSKITPLLERNNSPFFPDYTDHGSNHIQSVLRTCELIIADEAWTVFTREDAATLLIAALAHDLGMLIDIDGFRYLVDPQLRNNNGNGKKEIEWHKLWREYQQEVRRFDGVKLNEILGSSTPVSFDEFDLERLNDRGIKIIGEFLRRHHHRLAYEIVVIGMPSANGRIEYFHELPSYFKEIVGLIAMSHGMEIRECQELLMKIEKTASRAYRHIHPTYLMTLVRISDYLDMDKGRAPDSILMTKALKSPISKREWWANRTIIDCHSYGDDPECLRVIVELSEIPNVDTYMILNEKINGIQVELDSSWAALGETYGRIPPLIKLTLGIRRIKSNIKYLLDTNELPFVPHRAKLEAARSDLIKLLIAPLYGNKPGVGIRELVQNSLDAVRELKHFLKDLSVNISENEIEDIESDVVVTLKKDDEENYWVKIADKGIGMSWETICKYYLTAGASFRQSDAWKKRFTKQSGESEVLRSGRFGVGVLAAFLLGDQISISTRHVEQPRSRGIKFEFGLDDTNIELKWVDRKIGTTIEIKTTKEIIDGLINGKKDEFRWDWYCLDKPSIVRKNIEGKNFKQEYKLPGLETELPKNCHRLFVPNYQAVDWSYNNKYPQLVCNGLIINKESWGNPITIDSEFDRIGNDYYSYYNELRLKEPRISIFDPNGIFPLNLTRDNVTESPKEIIKLLTDDICRNFITYSLIKGPTDNILHKDQYTSYTQQKYPGLGPLYDYDLGPYFYTKDGFGLNDKWNISFFKNALLINTGKDTLHQANINNCIIKFFNDEYDVLLGAINGITLGDFDKWHRKLALSLITHYENGFHFFNKTLKGMRIYLGKDWYKRFADNQPQYILKTFKIEKVNDGYILFSGDCDKESSSLKEAYNLLREGNINFISITELYFNGEKGKDKIGRIAKTWKEAIGKPIIPFDRTERTKIIKKLGKEYERHIDEWES